MALIKWDTSFGSIDRISGLVNNRADFREFFSRNFQTHETFAADWAVRELVSRRFNHPNMRLLVKDVKVLYGSLFTG